MYRLWGERALYGHEQLRLKNLSTAQLSNVMGSFAKLTAIAALAATDGGTIVAEIPSATCSSPVHGEGTALSLEAALRPSFTFLPRWNISP